MTLRCRACLWRLLVTALALAVLSCPVQAADARGLDTFAVGLRICLNFGADPGMARIRFEDAGWERLEGGDWIEFTVPDVGVRALMSQEGASLPVFCRVEAERVSLESAGLLARDAARESGYLESSDRDEAGCPRHLLSLGAEVLVTSAGNAGTCDDPASASVQVRWMANLIKHQ